MVMIQCSNYRFRWLHEMAVNRPKLEKDTGPKKQRPDKIIPACPSCFVFCLTTASQLLLTPERPRLRSNFGMDTLSFQCATHAAFPALLSELSVLPQRSRCRSIHRSLSASMS